MKIVNYKIQASGQDVRSALYDADLIVSKEKFEGAKGTPKFHVKDKNGLFRIKCEYTGTATKDNAFLEGPYFVGRLSEQENQTCLRGIILTAPIYHLIIATLFIFFIVQCIVQGGFTPVPIILLVFSIFMFKDEFKKQAIIKKYIFRAFKNTFAKLNPDINQKIQ